MGGMCSECFWCIDDDDAPSFYPDDWNALRRRAYVRDGYACVNCSNQGEPLHAHHMVPAARGGTHRLSNLATLCESCHSKVHPHMAEHRSLS